MSIDQWKWFQEEKKDPREVTTHSLVSGNVLCRYWGHVEKSKEAVLIENAQINALKVIDAVNIINDLLSAVDVYREPLSWGEFLGEELAEKINTFLEEN